MSYQYRISPVLFLNCLKATQIDLPAEAEAVIDNPDLLYDQDVEIWLPLDLQTKRVFLDFTIADGQGRRLSLLTRQQSADLTLAYVLLQLARLLDKSGIVPLKEFRVRTNDDTGMRRVLRALIVCMNDRTRALYQRAGVMDDPHVLVCTDPACRRPRCGSRRQERLTRSLILAFVRQVGPRYFRTADDRASLAEVVSHEVPGIVKEAIELGRAIDALGRRSRGPLDILINPLLLGVEYLKALEEQSLELGEGVWTASSALDAVKKFFTEVARFQEFLRAVRQAQESDAAHRGVLGDLYELFWEVGESLIPFVPVQMTLGRAALIKVEQVVSTASPTGIEPHAPTTFSRRAWKALWEPVGEWLRLALFKVGGQKLAGGLEGLRAVWSRASATGHPIVLGQAQSQHFEFEAGTPSQVWQVPERSFLKMGRHRLPLDALFTIPAHESRERLHYYTTKTEREVIRSLAAYWRPPIRLASFPGSVVKSVRRGFGRLPMEHEGHAESREGLHALQIWIAYRLERSLDLTYWLAVVTTTVATAIFVRSSCRGPVQNYLAWAMPIIVLTMTTLVNLTGKDQLVADRIHYRRLWILLMAAACGVTALVQGQELRAIANAWFGWLSPVLCP